MGPRKKAAAPPPPLVWGNDQLGELSPWEEQLLAKLRLVKDVQVRGRPRGRGGARGEARGGGRGG
jgi:hypothetical protein